MRSFLPQVIAHGRPQRGQAREWQRRPRVSGQNFSRSARLLLVLPLLPQGQHRKYGHKPKAQHAEGDDEEEEGLIHGGLMIGDWSIGRSVDWSIRQSVTDCPIDRLTN